MRLLQSDEKEAYYVLLIADAIFFQNAKKNLRFLRLLYEIVPECCALSRAAG